MKNMLLVIPLLIGGCASENSSPKAILMDLIEQKNPVDIDWVNSFSGYNRLTLKNSTLLRILLCIPSTGPGVLVVSLPVK